MNKSGRLSGHDNKWKHVTGTIRSTLNEIEGVLIAATEPRFNKQGGRDHWPQCFSVVLAGGGIRGGQVYGSSDKIAAYPASNPVSPEDLMATLYTCLGVDPHALIYDQQNRPYPLVDGRPVQGLL